MKNIIKRFGSTLAIVASMAVVALGTMGAPVLADDCDANGGLGSGMNCAKNDDMPETLTGDNGIVTTVINTMLVFATLPPMATRVRSRVLKTL